MTYLVDLPTELLLRIAHYVREAEQHEADTTVFSDSPIIRSIYIDKTFWRSTLARFRDLRNLALSCRLVRPVAQDVLFNAPAIDNSVRGRHGYPTSLHRFLSTLFRRPHLARKVQQIHFDIDSCARYCSAGCAAQDFEYESSETCPLHKQLSHICRDLTQGTDTQPGPIKKIPTFLPKGEVQDRFYRDWNSLLSGGYGPGRHVAFETWVAISAIILHLAPNLSAISLNDQTEFNLALSYYLSGPPQFPLPLAIGHSSLTMLQTSCVPAWTILSSLSTLATIHIDLSVTRPWYLVTCPWYLENINQDWYPVDNVMACDHITKVVLDLNVTEIEAWEQQLNAVRQIGGTYALVKILLAHLGGVRDLQLRLVFSDLPDWSLHEHDEMPFERLKLGYDALVGYLQPPMVENIIIDTAGVNWPLYRQSVKEVTTAPILRFRPESIEPLEYDWLERSSIRNLRRIVCPQEMIFNPYFHPTVQWQQNPVLKSIVTVEIIDSTRLLNHWARYILQHREEYPDLRRIVLWCDRLREPLAPEPRLLRGPNTKDQDFRLMDAPIHPVNELQTGIPFESWQEVLHIPEERKLDDEGDEVWEELRNANIEVILNFAQNRGWRNI